MNFIDLEAQYKTYKEEIQAGINAVLSTQSFIMGPAVSGLEKDLQKYLNVEHAIGCSSGTDAILIALMALGVSAGDEVIVPAFTFIGTCEPVSLLGAIPVFTDIEEDTFNMDPASLEKVITKKTKAIIPVSLYGQVANMDKICAIAKTHNIPVIEDAAQSFGASYHSKKSCALTLISCTSFFPSKPLGAYGDAGAIFTNDPELAKSCRMILNHGSTKRYFHEVLGMNSRMDSLQAAVLQVKLKYLEKEIASRNKNANSYSSGMSQLDLECPTPAKNGTHAYAQYTIKTPKRDALIEHLKGKGIPSAIHYDMPLYHQPLYKSLNMKAKDFPVCEKVSKQVLSLPMCAFLAEENQKKVIDAISGFFR